MARRLVRCSRSLFDRSSRETAARLHDATLNMRTSSFTTGWLIFNEANTALLQQRAGFEQAAAAYELEAREVARHHVNEAHIDGARRIANIEVQAEQYIYQQQHSLRDATTENAALAHGIRSVTFAIEEQQHGFANAEEHAIRAVNQLEQDQAARVQGMQQQLNTAQHEYQAALAGQDAAQDAFSRITTANTSLNASTAVSRASSTASRAERQRINYILRKSPACSKTWPQQSQKNATAIVPCVQW